jgi:hypothetical protein
VGQIAKPMTSGLKSLGSNIVTMNKAGGVQTLQGLQVGGLGGKQTIVINKSGGQTIRYVLDPSLRRRCTRKSVLPTLCSNFRPDKNSTAEPPYHE